MTAESPENAAPAENEAPAEHEAPAAAENAEPAAIAENAAPSESAPATPLAGHPVPAGNAEPAGQVAPGANAAAAENAAPAAPGENAAPAAPGENAAPVAGAENAAPAAGAENGAAAAPAEQGPPKPEAPPPPPRSPLRAPPADFTGREAELKDLLEKMTPAGVAIAGLQGGIGKTTLALKLAQAIAPNYPDAQIEIDLRGSSAAPLSAAAAMAMVIRLFRPRARLPETEADLLPVYREALAGKRVLLVLDDAHSTEQVEPLLLPEGSTVIVTSAHGLSLPTLHARNVDNFANDAVALLERIAPRIDRTSATVIAALCHHSPLRLRLAASALAARVKLEPGDYIESLEAAQDGLELVDASLRVTFDLLDARIQLFWSCLGVFPGDFDREAAVEVGEIDPATSRKALGGLFKYGLIDYDARSKRFRLHDLARAYARGRLSEEDRRGAERRHAAHFARIAASANQVFRRGGVPSDEGLLRFDREIHNIEAGQAWAAANAANDDVAAALASAYPDAAVQCLKIRQQGKDRIRWREDALSAARRLERRDAEGVHLGNLGIAHAAAGELARAVELHEQQLAVLRELGDRRGEVVALGNLGIAHAARGDATRAVEVGEQALTLAREIGDRRGEVVVLGNLGLGCAAVGDTRRAAQLIKQQLRLARELGDRQAEANASWNLGRRYEAAGHVGRAIPFLEASVNFARAMGHPSADKDAKYVEGLRERLKDRPPE